MTVSTAIDPAAVARVLGVKTEFKELRAGNILFLPQRVAVIGQGNTAATYATTKRQVTSAAEAAQLYGSGSPIHLAVLQLLPVNGDGVGTIPVTIYPLEDDGSAAPALGDVTPGGSPTVAASYTVRCNEIDSLQFAINVGDSIADITLKMTTAINGVLAYPMIAADGATQVDLTSKWEGVSANDLVLEVIGSTAAGNTFGITQPAGGLVNPDIAAALAQVGTIWETLFVNCMEAADTTTLELYSVFGEGRWGALERKPMLAFSTDVTVAVATSITVPDARLTDRVNVQITAPGSKNLPFVISARAVARIAKLAASNPAHDYGSQNLAGLTPGVDGDQWDYNERDLAVKSGTSTTEVKDGVINLSDTVTYYHPAADPLPAYRFVVDIVKLMQVLFNLDLVFATTQWDGAPLIPDGQPTSNPDAKHPSAAVAAVATMIDGLALNALISDPEAAKKTIQAEIDSGNPKRLNVAFTIQLSGNTNIISVDLNFGFFFGVQSVVSS